MSTEFWEPWTPAIGQHVRIRLSAECQFQYRNGSQVKHFTQSDGAVGRVIDRHESALYGGCRHDDHDPGHRFIVLFDPPVVVEQHDRYRYRHTLVSQCFAAIELEPLEARP